MYPWEHSHRPGAKDALTDPISNCYIPCSERRLFIMKYILKLWEHSSDQQIPSKLHEMHSLIGKTLTVKIRRNKQYRPDVVWNILDRYLHIY